LRRTLFPRAEGQPIAYRLVNAESDGLPGIVVDRYAEWLVVQFLTLGASLLADPIVEVLAEHFKPLGIYSRSDVDVRREEGLAETRGVLRGDEPPDRIEIVENGLSFLVDVKQGHKTGFYLDQCTNRERVVPFLRGTVLNAFAYSGAFGVYAARRHASAVTNLDSSAGALDLARSNFERNGLQAEFVTGDAFQVLRDYRGRDQKFDAVVLDPPKFVTSAANLERAARGYKDLNLLAFQLLNPNGFLITFSCSGLVSPDLFQKIVFGAARDAKVDVQIVEKLGHAPDHPVSLNFPEGEYLKGFVLRIL
jgi:23S rRNA (cytosine1962-C5)-methyltransferase